MAKIFQIPKSTSTQGKVGYSFDSVICKQFDRRGSIFISQDDHMKDGELMEQVINVNLDQARQLVDALNTILNQPRR